VAADAETQALNGRFLVAPDLAAATERILDDLGATR
jgi:hypothetical protein